MAKVETMITLTRNEVYEKIPYPLVCETRYGKSWNTRKVHEKWLKEFTVEERQICYILFKKSRLWHIVRGVPDTVTMTTKTFQMWIKLGVFCGSL